MVKYNKVNVKLPDTQLKKFKIGIEKKKKIIQIIVNIFWLIEEI